MATDLKIGESLDRLVEEVEALAEHARLHGPAPDCGARMDGLIEKHRARIVAARRVEREALDEARDADR